MKRAIFLDRDGTLNVDVGYLHRLEDLELFPWTTDALRLPGGYYEPPPVVCYLDRGHGAAIRRARTRLPGADASAAFLMRLMKTCWIWSLSCAAGGVIGVTSIVTSTWRSVRQPSSDCTARRAASSSGATRSCRPRG